MTPDSQARLQLVQNAQSQPPQAVKRPRRATWSPDLENCPGYGWRLPMSYVSFLQANVSTRHDIQFILSRQMLRHDTTFAFLVSECCQFPLYFRKNIFGKREYTQKSQVSLQISKSLLFSSPHQISHQNCTNFTHFISLGVSLGRDMSSTCLE